MRDRSFSYADPTGELGKFADPFLLPSRESLPLSLTTAMDYCKFLYINTPGYASAAQRATAHFLTSIDYRGDIGTPKERTDFSQFFEEELHGFLILRQLSEEEWCYGNSFLRIHFPFVRLLVDRRGSLATYSLSTFPEELTSFNLKTMTYRVPDPARSDKPVGERPKIDLTFHDLPSKDFSKIRMTTLDPRYVRLRFSEWSLAAQVQYSFTPDMKSKVQLGNLHTVNSTPADVLQCIRDGNDYLFDSDAVYHYKTTTIAGVNNEGWGLSRIFGLYPTIHKIAVYDRIDETIGMDHLMPLRVLTPDLSKMSDRGRDGTIATEWMRQAKRMIESQRLDRTLISAFPFPVTLEALGGDGKALTPKDLKEFEIGQLLDNVNYPKQLYDLSLNSQQTPIAIRIFEAANYPMSHGLRGAIHFAVKRISNFMFGEAFDATLRTSTVADNAERTQMLFSLYSSGYAPSRVAFESLGIDQPEKLRVERAKEDLDIQSELQQLQKDEERKAALGSLNDVLDSSVQGGEGGAGGGGGGGGGAPVTTPTDLRAKAQQLAATWLAIPEDGKRRQAMMQVESTDPDLYAVAKDLMEEQKSQGESQGRAAVSQQAQQAAAQGQTPGQPPPPQ